MGMKEKLLWQLKFTRNPPALSDALRSMKMSTDRCEKITQFPFMGISL